jgi:uncharacterized protein YbbK (DUF523 family)
VVKLGIRIRVGISSCLLGNEVRYDGQHKRDPLLLKELGPLVEWVPVCPEVEVGMGVPRESVRLVRHPGGALMLGNSSGADWTLRMRALARERVKALTADGLSGYILKSRSPSCGLDGVKLYASADMNAAADEDGVGLFAEELARQLPDLPIEEDERLHDPDARKTFIERLFAYHSLIR